MLNASTYVSRYSLTPAIPAAPEYKELDLCEPAEQPKFDTETVHESVKAAHGWTKAWVRAILVDKPAYWLTLYGVPGCGKTMLAKLARHTLREKGKTVQFWNWPRVWRKCLDGEWDILDHLIELPILILDDVGAEFTGTRKTADLNTARLYEIAEGRLGKWTFITSNLNLDQMERDLGARFVSRIFRGDSQIVDLTAAEDYSYKLWLARNSQPQTTKQQ